MRKRETPPLFSFSSLLASLCENENEYEVVGVLKKRRERERDGRDGRDGREETECVLFERVCLIRSKKTRQTASSSKET